MNDFATIFRTLISEDSIDYNDICNAIEDVFSTEEKELLIKRLCDYAGTCIDDFEF